MIKFHMNDLFLAKNKITKLRKLKKGKKLVNQDKIQKYSQEDKVKKTLILP